MTMFASTLTGVLTTIELIVAAFPIAALQSVSLSGLMSNDSATLNCFACILSALCALLLFIMAGATLGDPHNTEVSFFIHAVRDPGTE